jgi:hypothetical protein
VASEIGETCEETWFESKYVRIEKYRRKRKGKLRRIKAEESRTEGNSISIGEIQFFSRFVQEMRIEESRTAC